MLKRLLLLICFTGIAVYSVKIYQLKDKVSFLPSSQNSTGTLHLQFYMESDQADLLSRCQQQFTAKTDKVALNTHPSNPKLATLSAERTVSAQSMQELDQLQKALSETGCLKSTSNRLSISASK